MKADQKMLVTFDSNVWRKVVSPKAFPRDPDRVFYEKINHFLQNGQLRGRLSETIFTLEAIERDKRSQALSSGRFNAIIQYKLEVDGSFKVTVQLAPDPSSHPGNSDYLNKHLEDAEKLGFQIMRCHRFGGLVNPDIKDSLYVKLDSSSIDQWMTTFAMVAKELETRGVGMSIVQKLGEEYVAKGQIWPEGLDNAPSADVKRAVAEWADGDSVAAHVAFGNYFFCTLDQGKSAGSPSVFSPENKLWLESEYQIKFVTPKELCELMS